MDAKFGRAGRKAERLLEKGNNETSETNESREEAGLGGWGGLVF
jgi:hypothetical protein